MSDEIKSRPQTREFDDNYDRIFGKDRRPVRGRWVIRDGQLVDVTENEETEARALDAPIMVDRFYENTVSPIDGADIGSRRKHRDYMKAHGLAMADDFQGEWAAKEALRERKTKDESFDDRSERQKLEARRQLYQRMQELERNPRRR